MRIGQKVMLICPLEYDYSWGGHAHPPVGTIGEITVGLDEYDEYEVSFSEYPHPAVNDPDWIIHKSFIIPINDDEEAQHTEEHEVLYA